MHIHKYRDWKFHHELTVEGEFSTNNYDVWLGTCSVCGKPKMRRVR